MRYYENLEKWQDAKEQIDRCFGDRLWRNWQLRKVREMKEES